MIQNNKEKQFFYIKKWEEAKNETSSTIKCDKFQVVTCCIVSVKQLTN